MIILVVAVIATADAAAGPVYYRAAQHSILANVVSHAPFVGRGYEATLTGPVAGTLSMLQSALAEELNHDLGAAASQRVFAPPVDSIDAATGVQSQVEPFLIAWRTGFCAHLVITGHCPAGAKQVLVSQPDARLAGWHVGSQINAVAWPTLGHVRQYGFTLRSGGGRLCHARTVLIATGVSYRRLDAPGIDGLLGAGVYYGATASESAAFAGEHVFIAGGANSAGQAAVNLARYAQQVTIVVRGESLAARMSQYLIDEISASANIDVRTGTVIAAAQGAAKLEALSLLNTATGRTETVPASALLVMIGAEPRSDWLPAEIARDDHGFIITGGDLTARGPTTTWHLSRQPRSLETSMPGVFAAGDIRHGSVKRVASSVGEGSIAATQMNQYLEEQGRGSPAPA